MTTIERIGNTSVVALRGTSAFAVIDRTTGDLEWYTSEVGAHQAALERADLVDGLEAMVH